MTAFEHLLNIMTSDNWSNLPPYPTKKGAQKAPFSNHAP